MPIDASQINEEMIDAAVHGGRIEERLSALLNLPETRRIIAEAVEQEHAAMMAALPSWEEMSDLDKGAALLHLWKRESEGDDYAIENYPAKFIEDPRLTALNRTDACAHAARFEDKAEDLAEENNDEWYRLYNLALDHERSS